MLFLQAENPKKDIQLYVNSPGGNVTSGLAIIDTMNHIKNNISTICVGLAASMGAMILANGTKGKRMALPYSEIMIHQPHGAAEGQITDMELTLKLFAKHKDTLAKMLSKNTGQSVEKVKVDMERDHWLGAPEAKKYGIIDQVIS